MFAFGTMRGSDLDKVLGNTPLVMFDRDTCNVAKSQIGFLTFVVRPNILALEEFLDPVGPVLSLASLPEALKKSKRYRQPDKFLPHIFDESTASPGYAEFVNKIWKFHTYTRL